MPLHQQTKEEPVLNLRQRLHQVLEHSPSTTRHIELGTDAIGNIADAVRATGLPSKALCIAQPETRQATEHALTPALDTAGMEHEWHITHATGVDDAAVQDVEDVIAKRPGWLPLAVGAGTVNDTVKMAAQQASIPYACVATAASMNGYPSAISAIMRDGLKRTIPAAPPVLIVADTDILRHAPEYLNRSGYADLLAKPCSVADWILARDAAGEPFEPEPLAIVDGVVESVVAQGEAIAAAEPGAIEDLTAGLLLSGLSMAAAGTSQPASGGEHLISHFWDIIGHRDGWKLDLHGRQVGIGCLLMSGLWERLLSLSASDLMPAPGAAAEHIAEQIADVYGPLAEPAIAETRAKAPTEEAVAERVAKARQAWPVLREELADSAVSVERMRADLLAGGAVTTLAEVGRTPEDAKLALKWARTMRNRYTCMDLAAEIGMLDGWIDELVAEVC